MRKFVLACLLALPFHAWSTNSFQTGTGHLTITDSTTSISTVTAINVAPGDLIVVFGFFSYGAGTSITSVTDSSGNAFQSAGSGCSTYINGSDKIETWYSYAANASTSDIVTLTFSAAVTNPGVSVVTYRGGGVGLATEACAVGITASGTSVTSGSFSPAAPGDLAVAFVGSNNCNAITPGAGYTIRPADDGLSYSGCLNVEDNLNVAAGAQTASATIATPDQLMMSVVTFKAAGSGPLQAFGTFSPPTLAPSPAGCTNCLSTPSTTSGTTKMIGTWTFVTDPYGYTAYTYKDTYQGAHPSNAVITGVYWDQLLQIQSQVPGVIAIGEVDLGYNPSPPVAVFDSSKTPQYLGSATQPISYWNNLPVGTDASKVWSVILSKVVPYGVGKTVTTTVTATFDVSWVAALEPYVWNFVVFSWGTSPQGDLYSVTWDATQTATYNLYYTETGWLSPNLIQSWPASSGGASSVFTLPPGQDNVFYFYINGDYNSQTWDQKTPALACNGNPPCTVGTFDGANCNVYTAPSGSVPYAGSTELWYQAVGVETCPAGGTWDGAHCYFGTPPSGTNPFVLGQNLYYHAVMVPTCPGLGWYDGAHCFIGTAPSGSNPFMYNGNMYYHAASGNVCSMPNSTWDGAHCYVPVPSGTSGLIWSGNFYYYAVQVPTCPGLGWWDGLHCYVGTAPAGSAPLVWNNGCYYTGIISETCPAGGVVSGTSCNVAAIPQTPIGVRPFIVGQTQFLTPNCLP